MFEFFFIGKTEVCRYKANVPPALVHAVRQRHATVMKKAARIVGFLSAVMVLIVPAALIATQLTSNKIGSSSLMTASIVTVVAGLALIGSFLLHRNAKHIESLRRKIARGYEREFYLSSTHYSFKLIFTPEIRKLINSGTEEGNATYHNLYALLMNRSAISADVDILSTKNSDEVSYTRVYEAKALLISRAESAVVSPGASLKSFFAARRLRLVKDFEAWEKEVTEQINLTKAELTRFAEMSPLKM